MFVSAILAVSALATLLFGFVALDALIDTVPLQRSPLVRHALLGATACLLLVLAQTWIAFFLAGTGRALRKAAGAGGGTDTPEWLEAARRARRVAIPWVVAVPLSALTAFLLGGALFSGLAPKWSHGLACGVSLVVQLTGLWIEWGSLARHEAAFARADRELSSRSAAEAR